MYLSILRCATLPGETYNPLFRRGVALADIQRLEFVSTRLPLLRRATFRLVEFAAAHTAGTFEKVLAHFFENSLQCALALSFLGALGRALAAAALALVMHARCALRRAR